jgi:hypothetical protein
LVEVVREPARTGADVQHRHSIEVFGETVRVNVGSDVVVASDREAVVEVVAVISIALFSARGFELVARERPRVVKPIASRICSCRLFDGGCVDRHGIDMGST